MHTKLEHAEPKFMYRIIGNPANIHLRLHPKHSSEPFSACIAENYGKEERTWRAIGSELGTVLHTELFPTRKNQRTCYPNKAMRDILDQHLFSKPSLPTTTLTAHLNQSSPHARLNRTTAYYSSAGLCRSRRRSTCTRRRSLLTTPRPRLRTHNLHNNDLPRPRQSSKNGLPRHPPPPSPPPRRRLRTTSNRTPTMIHNIHDGMMTKIADVDDGDYD